MSEPFKSFFGSGYKENTNTTFNASINLMGKIYNGNIIELNAGNVIVDGVIKDKIPVTSGTWYKILKGTEKNKIIS